VEVGGKLLLLELLVELEEEGISGAERGIGWVVTLDLLS